MHISNMDLNLLKMLEVLLDERHVSRAAARCPSFPNPPMNDLSGAWT
jgi:hypothetical protein